jgi:hypothetical protein
VSYAIHPTAMRQLLRPTDGQHARGVVLANLLLSEFQLSKAGV